MKVVVFGKYRPRTRTTGFIVDAFRRAGHQVLWLNRSRWKRLIGKQWTARLLARRARRFGPDLVFSMTTDCPTEVLAGLSKTCIVSVYTDRYNFEVDPGMVERGKASHVLFMAVDGHRQDYIDAAVPNVVYLPQACDGIAHRRADPGRFGSDIAFVGKPKPLRINLINKINERFDLKVYGPGWKGTGISIGRNAITPRSYAQVCAGTSVMLGADVVRDVPLCFSNRTYIIMGCGGFLLTSYVPGLEEIFENRKHLVWYESDEECLELIDYYLKNPDERRVIADEGYRHVHEHYTYDHFVKRLLDTVSGLET
jgi:hypothetical protein